MNLKKNSDLMKMLHIYALLITHTCNQVLCIWPEVSVFG